MCDPAATGLHKHVAFDKNFHEKVETAGEMKEIRTWIKRARSADRLEILTFIKRHRNMSN